MHRQDGIPIDARVANRKRHHDHSLRLLRQISQRDHVVSSDRHGLARVRDDLGGRLEAQ